MDPDPDPCSLTTHGAASPRGPPTPSVSQSVRPHHVVLRRPLLSHTTLSLAATVKGPSGHCHLGLSLQATTTSTSTTATTSTFILTPRPTPTGKVLPINQSIILTPRPTPTGKVRVATGKAAITTPSWRGNTTTSNPTPQPFYLWHTAMIGRLLQCWCWPITDGQGIRLTGSSKASG